MHYTIYSDFTFLMTNGLPFVLSFIAKKIPFIADQDILCVEGLV